MFRLSISWKSRKEKNERIKHRANMDCDYIALHHVILARKKRIRLENRRTAYKYYVGICFCVSCSKNANISVISRYCSWMESESLLLSSVLLNFSSVSQCSLGTKRNNFLYASSYSLWEEARQRDAVNKGSP